MYTFLLGKNLARAALIIGICQILLALIFFYVTSKMAEVYAVLEMGKPSVHWVQGLVGANIILGLINLLVSFYLYKNPKKNKMGNMRLKTFVLLSSLPMFILMVSLAF